MAPTTPTRLRIPNDVKETEVKLVRETLQKSASFTNVDKETLYTSGDQELILSIQKRCESFKQAFEFIWTAFPEKKPPFINNFLNNTMPEFNKLMSFEDAKKLLDQYTKQLVSAILYFRFGNKETHKAEAIELLNKAEQYVISLSPRAPIATVIPFNNHYIILSDKPKPALHPDTKKELLKIKALNKVPAWFEKLSPHAKYYLLTLKLPAITEKTQNEWIKKIQHELNGSEKTNSAFWNDLEKLSNEKLKDAEEQKDIEKQKELFKSAIKELNEVFKNPNGSMLDDVRNLQPIGIWYYFLDESEQTLLSHFLQSRTPEQLDNLFLTSRHRTIPGLANGGEHQCVLVDQNGNIVWESPIDHRAAHLASRDMKNTAPPTVQALHTERNIATLKSGLKSTNVFVQTHISPSLGTDTFSINFPLTNVPLVNIKLNLPDAYLQKQLITGLSKEIEQNHTNFVFANKPLNMEGTVLPSSEKDTDIQIVLKKMEDYIKTTNDSLKTKPNQILQDHLKSLQVLINQYQQILQVSWSSNVRNPKARELWLGALEQLIMRRMGYDCFGSCASNKDRKAFALMMADSVELYYKFYKEWPSYFDGVECTEKLDLIYAVQYLSGHHQIQASDNAEGARGLKTAQNYLPTSTLNMILKLSHKGYAINEDILATVNEVDKIVTQKTPLIDNFSLWYGVGILPLEQQEELLEEIKNCAAQTTINSPYLSSIVSMANKYPAETLSTVLTNILSIEKDTKPANNTEFVNKFYQTIEALRWQNKKHSDTNLHDSKTWSVHVKNKTNTLLSISPCYMASKKLFEGLEGSERFENIINLIKVICGQKSFWNQGSGLSLMGIFAAPGEDPPKGIQKILDLYDKDPQTNEERVLLFAKILSTIRKREEQSSKTRGPNTSKFYAAMMKLREDINKTNHEPILDLYTKVHQELETLRVNSLTKKPINHSVTLTEPPALESWSTQELTCS